MDGAVIVRFGEEMQQIHTSNPHGTDKDDSTRLHVILLDARLSPRFRSSIDMGHKINFSLHRDRMDVRLGRA